MVDSLGQEQLVDHIHEVYGFELTDGEMIRENFASLPALAALVASKLSR
jgi:acyl carrier protein